MELDDLSQKIRCMRTDIKFVSLNDEQRQHKTGAGPHHFLEPEFSQCMEDVLDIFGISSPSYAPLLLDFYCCAHFAVSRSAVRAVPLSAWQRAYGKLGLGRGCGRGSEQKPFR
jgi:hypothetical protein